MSADAAAAYATPRNWDLYRTAVVGIRYGDRAVRVEPRPLGTTGRIFPAPFGRPAVVHVLTAWNPRGRTASADANARAQSLLLAEVRHRALTWWPAWGGDAGGTHREESVAVVGLDDGEARALGHRFGQDAVFAWTPAAWRVLACDTHAVAASGWAASAHALPSATESRTGRS